MGPELELNPKSEAAIEVLAVKENGSTPPDLEDKFMPCVSNYKDNIFDMEGSLVGQTTASNRCEDEELNITGCVSPDNVQMVESECLDLTENSSSFGDTISGTENGPLSDCDEVESRLCGNASVSVYDGYYDAFRTRKKKLTVHWRKFIQPLMWRCKWLELQIKELRSQALKYDRELAEYDNIKQFEFERFAREGFDAKSIPFSSQIQREKVMKRKKRKRVEDTTDIASYMSHHNLFSYNENKRSIANAASMEDDFGTLAAGRTSYGNNEFEINDIWSSLEFRDGNSSLEDILWKIEVVHSQVCQLKTRIDKVVNENPGNISSINKFLVPSDALKGFAQNPASPPENGNRLLVETLPTASQHISECNMGDLFLSESAVPSHGELTPVPGMTRNPDQPWVGCIHENAENGYLIPNAVKEEPHDFEKVEDQLIQKPQLSIEEQKANFPVPGSKTVLPTKSSAPKVTQESVSTTRTDFPWNTRNRGRRKAGSYRCIQKSSS